MIRGNQFREEDRQRKRALWAIAAVIAVGLAYANSFHKGFHFDDIHTIVDNPWIRSLHNVPRFFVDAGTFSVLPANRSYRPVVSTSLALDHALGRGYNPAWFHVTTFAVFLAQLVVMALFFSALLRCVPARGANPPKDSRWLPHGTDTALIALAAAAWYGLHPAMAETVNYIIQRGDIFSTAGVTAAMAVYACLPRLRRTGLYLVPFALGLLSKPPAIVLPVLLFAYVAYFEAEAGRRWRRAAIAAVPSAIVGAVLMGLQLAMTPKTFLSSEISQAAYLLTQPFVLLRYFGSFLLPVHLNVDTDLMAFHRFNAEAFIGLVFVALLLGAIALTARRPRWRPVSYGLLWFLVASLPTSIYRLSEVENDHRMYMPFVGLALAVTWAVFLLAERIAAWKPQWPALRPAMAATLCLLLAAYAWGTHLRNQKWRTEESLWLDDVQKSPHNGRGLMNYGLTQMAKGEYRTALDYFQRALLYTPNYAVLEVNLGIASGALEDAAAAESHFRRAISLAPISDEPYLYYGRWLFETGRTTEAVARLETAVRLNPSRLMARDLLIQAYALTGEIASARRLAEETVALAPSDRAARSFLDHPSGPDADAWITLSLARYRQKDYAGCISAAREALRRNPRSALAYNNIGAAYAGMGEWKLAAENEKLALAILPDLLVAKNNLAFYESQLAASAATAGKAAVTAEEWLNRSLRLHQAGRYRESATAARMALKLRPGYAEAWNNIAAACQSMERWDEAIAAAQEAIRLKPDFQLARNNLAWSLEQQRKRRSAH